MLAVARGVRSHYERDASIAQVFVAAAARTPDAVAIVDDSQTLSYRELEERSNRFARHLLALGVRAGQVVGVAFERSIDLPVVLLGILKTGAAYAALDASYPGERLAHLIRDASIAVVVTRTPLCDATLANTTVVSVSSDAAQIAARSAAALELRGGSDALAYVAYTSGSTGRPKGVTISQRGVLRLVRGADFFDVSPEDVFLHHAPLSFDASTFEIWAPLLNGARLAIAPPGRLSFEDLGRVLERFGVTTLWLTAPLFRLMVASELARFGAVRQLLTGGDVVCADAAVRFLETFPACRLIDGYGPTENTTFSCCYRIPSPDAIRAGVPIGRPIANSTAYVVDEAMALVASGVTGELCVGGDGLSSGYLNLPELTAERFVADPFANDPSARLYRTGDLARVRADGVIEFVGRLDDQVKIRGFRVEPAEIESALRAHAGIADAALSVITLAGEKALHAHVVRATGAQVTEHDVRSFLAAKLPAHMIPARIGFIAALPAHPSGKLDRLALTQLASRAAAVPATTTPGVGGRNARARTIARCWQEILETPDGPDYDENFFDAGGDSLRLLALHARLQRELQLSFGIVDLFEHGTIRKLAAFVNARLA
jgi:amino acid adenylation domain-containing protein